MTECRLIEPSTLLVSRRYRAPRGLVWKAWTEPARLKRWFGGADHVLEEVDIDLRVGGSLRKVFRSPQGDRVTVSGEYREVVEPEKLVHTWNVTGGGYAMRGTLVTITFATAGQMTEVTVRHEGLDAAPDRASHQKGWIDSLDRLAAEVESAA